ncbi:MAG TPA: hypothetical protein VHK47_03420 [Polyangia bacterium]|jgi:hypothetical protein|nr:hypothetical protein [Polyangia bacterium]
MMFVPGVLVAFALVSADLDRPPVREELATGAWFEPLLRFHAIGSGRADVLGSDASPLPLGIEVGHRVGPAFVSVSLADLPIDARQTLAAAGVRVYHGTGLAATYLAAQVGAIRERIREGSPLVVNPFAMLGPGLELALRGGFSATADFLIGAENRGDGPERSWTSSWHLSGLFRLGVGARF